MKSDTEIRNQIMKRIKSIPSEKLEELNNYIVKLECNIKRKERILSFAGSWKDFEDDVFGELLDNVLTNRRLNKRRFDE